jgi:hypothetical protein
MTLYLTDGGSPVRAAVVRRHEENDVRLAVGEVLRKLRRTDDRARVAKLLEPPEEVVVDAPVEVAAGGSWPGARPRAAVVEILRMLDLS